MITPSDPATHADHDITHPTPPRPNLQAPPAARTEPTADALTGASTTFDRVVIIYNPNSTGDAPQLARRLHDDLAAILPGVRVDMAPTEHAGHGRDLALDAARTGRPLLVSVSGDGGYNEVVDGAMHSANPHVTCAVMAAGNANDHRRTTKERPLAEAIAHAQTNRMDLLTLTTNDGRQERTRYAHSYIGVGLTPVVAIDLENGGKGSVREMVSLVRTFARFRPFTITLEDGQRLSVDSLLFANIAQMAKHATLSETGDPQDGKFEVITIPHTAKWKVLGVALKAITRGLGPQPTATHYSFTTLKPTPLQLDGEVLTLDAHTQVTIDIAPQALSTIT